jgi:hypothetical protein
MGSFESTAPKPGVIVHRLQGVFSGDDLNTWREALLSFFKDNHKQGACGVLIDARKVEGISTEALNTLCEILAEPPDEIQAVRSRFAFIGVGRYTERFMRAAMPITKISHLRGRFFHETSEEEAVAWLSAMVESADDLPEVRPVTPAEKVEPVPASQGKPEPQKEAKEAVKEPKQEKEKEKGAEQEKEEEREKETLAPAKPTSKLPRLPITLRRE